MHWFVCAAAASLCVVAPAAQAQQLYRCGNTFSQVPCAPDATKLRTPSGSSGPDAPGAPALKGKELCAAEAPRQLGVNDPENIRVDSVVRGSAEVIQYAGQPMAARSYQVNLIYRNQAGVFATARPVICYLSEDERRVLKINARQEPGQE
jgi:hypothetical protein